MLMLFLAVSEHLAPETAWAITVVALMVDNIDTAMDTLHHKGFNILTEGDLLEPE